MSKPPNNANINTPSHIYLNDSSYFITAATFQHQKLLNAEIKNLLQELLHQVFAEYDWTLHHWVILDNHYHLLANSCKGQDLPRIINKIHNQSAQLINRLFPPEQRPHKKVWYNYWDYCPRNEWDYNVRLCYLLNNPVKHEYVETLNKWPWSSFNELYEDRGDTESRKLFLQHREYRDLQIPEDDF